MPRPRQSPPAPDRDHNPDRNQVLLSGRLAAAPIERALPSGDTLVTWRLVVRRDPAAVRASRAAPAARTATVDTIECASTRPDVRRRAAGWSGGELLEVRGALRRRFFRAPGGATSRYEVEAVAARRLTLNPARARPARSAVSG